MTSCRCARCAVLATESLDTCIFCALPPLTLQRRPSNRLLREKRRRLQEKAARPVCPIRECKLQRHANDELSTPVFHVPMRVCVCATLCDVSQHGRGLAQPSGLHAFFTGGARTQQVLMLTRWIFCYVLCRPRVLSRATSHCVGWS